VKINKCCKKDYKNKFRPSPAVKKDAGCKNNNVFKFFGNKIIEKQKCRQEI
jgi:hypothetical protein